MARHLEAVKKVTWKQRLRLIANLSELFAQIDVNGDERMEWEELINFLVEVSRLSQYVHSPSLVNVWEAF